MYYIACRKPMLSTHITKKPLFISRLTANGCVVFEFLVFFPLYTTRYQKLRNTQVEGSNLRIKNKVELESPLYLCHVIT